MVSQMQENSKNDLQPKNAEEIKDLFKKISKLEKQCKEEAQKKRKLEEKRASFQEEISSLQEKLKREKKQKVSLENKMAEKDTELWELEDSLEKRIQAGVEREMKSVVRTWLKKPLKHQQAVSRQDPKEGSDILQRAQDVLARQQVHDREFGNRKFLSQRLENLQKASREISQCAQESLNPLPELAEIKQKLDEEILQTSRVLGQALSPNVILDNLKMKINASSSHEELVPLKVLLSDLEQNDLLSLPELKENDTQLFRPELAKDYFQQDYRYSERYKRIPDYRNQLVWEPQFRLDSTSKDFSFYTSDVKGAYEVVLEGFNEQGKPLSLRRVIEVR